MVDVVVMVVMVVVMVVMVVVMVVMVVVMVVVGGGMRCSRISSLYRIGRQRLLSVF